MQGQAPIAPMGGALPVFVTRAQAIAWTGHPSPDRVGFVSARRWLGGGPDERWILVAGDWGPGFGDPTGEYHDDVRLAVIEVHPSSDAVSAPSVHLVARTAGPLQPRPDWLALPDDYEPVALCDEDESAGCAATGPVDGLDDATQLSSLDLGAFDVAPSQRAFGVRTTRTEGYAGGFATYETLSLLLVRGETLVPILDVPVFVLKMLAGDWNADQTRQHETLEAGLVLEVRPLVGGMATLLLHLPGRRDALAFSWDATRGAYGCP